MSALTLSVLLQLSAVTAAPASYDVAYNKSMETGQPLLVMVGAEWCPQCVQMKQTVLPDLQKQSAFRNVSFATVNPDKQAKLAQQLTKSTSVPQLVLYRKSSVGWTRTILSGGQTTASVVSFLKTPATQASWMSRPIQSGSP